MKRNDFIHQDVLAQVTCNADIPTSLLISAAVRHADAVEKVAPFEPEVSDAN